MQELTSTTLSWLGNLANAAIIGGALLGLAGTLGTIFVTGAQSRQSDLRMKQAEVSIESSRTDAAQANAEAAKARADAERAKLETANVGERLALTQLRLDDANRVTPFTQAQVDQIVHDIIELPLEGIQPIGEAANDLQAQRRLHQLTSGFMQQDHRLYGQTANMTVGFTVPPEGEQGDILVHYWSDDRREIAERFAEIFRRSGLEANIYKLSMPLEPQAAYLAPNAVLLFINARSKPKYMAGAH